MIIVWNLNGLSVSFPAPLSRDFRIPPQGPAAYKNRSRVKAAVL